MTAASVIYVVCKDETEARKIASALLAECLIACANIFPPHLALYRWDGKEEEGRETAMILKTRSDLFDAVSDKIRELHSYQCPCIISLKVEQGYGGYLDWIESETL